jgi:hypothetical protein
MGLMSFADPTTPSLVLTGSKKYTVEYNHFVRLLVWLLSNLLLHVIDYSLRRIGSPSLFTEGQNSSCQPAWDVVDYFYKTSNQERKTKMNNNKPIYTFWDDKPNGGMIVVCSVCEGHFDTPNTLETYPRFQTDHTCPHCKTDLIYPEYASW